MRRFIFYLIIVAISLIPMQAFCENDGESDNSEGSHEDIPKDLGGRPKAPEYRNLIYGVEDGMLSISFRKAEGNANVEVKNLDNGFVLSYEFDSSIPFRCSLPMYPASYQITVKTARNNTYTFEVGK